MNICQSENKREVWDSLKSNFPDGAKLISEIIKAFPGKYETIIVSKVNEELAESIAGQIINQQEVS